MDEPLHDVMHEIDRSASECVAEMREKAAELCDAVETYVRREPVKAAIIAGGLGLVVGLIFARR